MPNISNGRLIELERAEKELKAHVTREACRPFAEKLILNIGTMLAMTPYERWPGLCKAAFREASKDIPTGAQIYKSLLPENDL